MTHPQPVLLAVFSTSDSMVYAEWRRRKQERFASSSAVRLTIFGQLQEKSLRRLRAQRAKSSHAQNWNLHGANDRVTVELRGLAQHLRHVTAAD